MDNKGKVIDFYCCDLPSLKYTSAKKFENINDLLDEYYAVKDKQDRLTSKACSLTKLVKNNIERCEKKQKILNNELSDCLKKEDYKIKGELLTSYIHSLKQGEKEVTIQNYYSENLEEIKIKLDPLKTPSENVQSYFKKYNKLKKTESAANEQLEKNTEELDYLNSVLTSIINAEEYTDIDRLAWGKDSEYWHSKNRMNTSNSSMAKKLNVDKKQIANSVNKLKKLKLIYSKNKGKDRELWINIFFRSDAIITLVSFVSILFVFMYIFYRIL